MAKSCAVVTTRPHEFIEPIHNRCRRFSQRRRRRSRTEFPASHREKQRKVELALARPGHNTVSREMTPVKFILQTYLVYD